MFPGSIALDRCRNSDADIEAKDGTKWTALMRAATNGNMEVVRLLQFKAPSSPDGPSK